MGLNPPATITAFDATSAQGGNVVVNANGTFTYNPPPGYAGADSFHYTLSNATGSSVGTVNLNISGMVWFINNNAAACTTLAAGCGRLSNPFSTLAAFNLLNNGTGNNPAANDNIFIYESATQYTGAVTLLSGQKLIGQDATASLATITGLTPPSSSPSFPAMNSGNATVTNIGSTVTLNTNATVRGLSINSTTSTGMSGGAVSGVSVSEVNVTTTTGTAVSLSGTGGTLSFKSVSSNGAANGISLTNTTGSFTVSGDGASDPNNTTRGNTTAKSGGGTITLGSGGTIQNTTGSGIILTNASSVSLTSMNILNAGGASVNTGNEGIKATNVNGLTLDNVKITGSTGNSGLRGYSSAGVASITNLSMQHVDIDGNGTALNTEANNNWNVRIDDLAGNCGDATNGCGWNNSLFFNSRENIVGLQQGVNFTTVAMTLTVSNSEVRDTTTFANPANDAFLIDAFNTAKTGITVTGSTLKNVEVGGFQYNGNDNSSGTVNVLHNSIENTGSDILLAHGGGSGGNSTLTFDIFDNTERQTAGNPQATVAVNVFLGGLSGGSSLMTGKIVSNTIGNSGVAFSGSHIGDGIDVNATGAGTIVATVISNTVHQIKTGDAFFGEANSGSAKLDLFIHNNSFNVDQNGTATAALHVVGGAVGTDTATTCADVAANTLHGDPTYASVELDALGAGTSGIKLVGYGGATDDSTAIAFFFNSNNTSVTPAATASFMVVSGGHIQSAPNCGITFPTASLPFNDQSVAYASVKAKTINHTQGLNTPANSANALNFPFDFANAFKQSAWRMPHEATATLVHASISGDAQGSPLPHSAAAPLSAPVSVSIGTLNPGKSVTIKFRVTVNSPWPNNTTAQVSNQGTVSGGNFTSVLTDDPAVGGASDPTVTTINLASTFAQPPASGTCAGNMPCYDTLSAAITNVGANGTVDVFSGTFNEAVTLNKTAGLSVTQDITVNGAMTLAQGWLGLSGDLNLPNTFSLTLGLAVTTTGTGDVWGNTVRNHVFTPGTPYSFGNPNVSITFASGVPPSAIKVSLSHGVPVASGFGNAVQRMYAITPVGGGVFAATLRLHYQDAEMFGNTESALDLWRYQSGNWTQNAASARDTTANWAERTSISTFSPWVLASSGPQAPTAVTVSEFNARARVGDASGAVLLALLGLVAGGGALAWGWTRRRRTR